MIQDTPADLPDIVVTAARLPPAASEAAFSVVRIGEERLSRETRLDEALRSVPAVSLFRRTSSLAANPTTQGISLRAIAPSGAGRTLVMLDGVPLNDPFGGWVIWSQIPTESLSGLDIVRGAGAGPYGAGALTGVIGLRERDSSGGALELSGGELGGQRMGAATTLSAGRFSLTGALQREVSDGYTPVRGPAAGAVDTPLDLETQSGSLRLDAALAGAVALSLRASAYDEERGSGLVGARSSASGESYSATVSRAPNAERPGWRAQVWRRTSDFANTSVAVAAGRGSTTPANDQFATPAEGWGWNVAVRRTAVLIGTGQLEWEVGTDARFNEGETRELFRFMGGAFTRDRVAGGETSVIGAYGEASWTGGPWLVAGGLRIDGWENAAGRRIERDRATGLATLNETDPDRSGEVISARLAARRDLSGGWAGRVAAYSGFRPATLNELHRPFRVGNDLTEANAALVPETLQGVEAGLSWNDDATEVQAAVFWNRLDDAIINVTLGAGPATFPRAGFVPAGGVLRQRQNAGTIEAVGLEASVTHRIDDRLNLDAAVSLTEAEVDGGMAARQLTSLRPAQAPEISASAGAVWQATDRLTLVGRVRYEGARFEDDLNSRTLDEAVTLDARAEWTVRDGVIAFVAADNLFDAEVEVSETGDGVEGFGPPRVVRAGLSLRW